MTSVACLQKSSICLEKSKANKLNQVLQHIMQLLHVFLSSYFLTQIPCKLHSTKWWTNLSCYSSCFLFIMLHKFLNKKRKDFFQSRFYLCMHISTCNLTIQITQEKFFSYVLIVGTLRNTSQTPNNLKIKVP